MPRHCGEARAALLRTAAGLDRHGRRAVVERARALARLARAPAEHVARHRTRLHQQAARAAGQRDAAPRRRAPRSRARRAVVLDRQAKAAAGARGAARRAALDGLALALDAHDPERIVRRGYAVVDDRDGGVADLGRRGAPGGRGAPVLPRRRRGRHHRAGGDDMTAPTYETATGRLEEIIRRLDSGEAGLRETLDLVKRGPRPGRVLRRRARGRRPRARGAAPRRARRAPGARARRGRRGRGRARGATRP